MRKYLSPLFLLFLISFFLFTSSCLWADVLLGDQNIESNLDSNPAGRAEAFPTTAGASGVLSSLSLYVDANSTVSQIVIGLYSDASGHPSLRLTEGVFTPQPGAWNTVSVAPVAVVAGTNYWIAVLGLGSGNPYFRDTATGCTSETSSSDGLSSLPATWATGQLWATCGLSAYGSTSDNSAVTVAVTVSPTAASLPTGGTQQFTAAVTGTANSAVTWSATGGAITASGMYTAPATAGTYTVTATSAADTTQSASATVVVSAAALLLGDQNVESDFDSHFVGRAEAFQTVAAAGGVLNFLSVYVDAASTASQIAVGLYDDSGGHPSSLLTQATFAPQAANWNTVNVPAVPVNAGTTYWIAVLGLGDGRPGFRSSGITCNSEGSALGQTALPSAWSTGRFYGRCAVSAYGTGLIPSAAVAVSVSPASASLPAGGSQQFVATVTGTSNTAVAWSATGGSISPDGVYIAPSVAGSYVVTATSAADPTQSASATVTVNAPPVIATAVSISPTSASLPPGGVQQFTATVTGMTNTAVTWTASAGNIFFNGLYIAPSVAGTYVVTATSAADPALSASATVTVNGPVAVTISPAVLTISLGGTQQFTANVTGTSNTAVTWTASGGTISASGLFTAPPALVGVYVVTATSVADPTKSASAIVTVVGGLLQHSVTLNWDASSTSSVIGYNAYRATQSGGPYTMINTALQPGTTYVDLTVAAGHTYYYVVTAVDSGGMESDNSNEATAVVPLL